MDTMINELIWSTLFMVAVVLLPAVGLFVYIVLKYSQAVSNRIYDVADFVNDLNSKEEAYPIPDKPPFESDEM